MYDHSRADVQQEYHLLELSEGGRIRPGMDGMKKVSCRVLEVHGRPHDWGSLGDSEGLAISDVQVATPASPTRKLLAGEDGAAPKATSGSKAASAQGAPSAQGKALPTDPVDIWLQSYGPCKLPRLPSTDCRLCTRSMHTPKVLLEGSSYGVSAQGNTLQIHSADIWLQSYSSRESTS